MDLGLEEEEKWSLFGLKRMRLGLGDFRNFPFSFFSFFLFFPFPMRFRRFLCFCLYHLFFIHHLNDAVSLPIDQFSYYDVEFIIINFNKCNQLI